MTIEYLRLKGFKSFGASCELHFSDGMTAITGPNGSGKSNILYAIRWTLGESNSATLRIKEQSDLIFKGSAFTEPAKEAEVILKLTSKGTPEESGTIRRQYTTENGSILQVDGARVCMQDITDFKARFMIEGYRFAFIGIDEVLEAIKHSMKRRYYLELLFGIDRYRKRSEETNRKLDKAMSKIRRINTIVSELEARREEIAPEVALAVEARGMDNPGTLSEDEALIERIEHLSAQVKDVQANIDRMKILIDETDSQADILFTQNMIDIDARFNAIFKRLFNGGEAHLSLQKEGTIWNKGVEIYAQPPSKVLMEISQLAWGDQVLTAIAYLFSVLEIACMPLAVLDEVDALLDEAKLIRFADLLKEYSKSLQLIVITQNRTAVERADIVYSVTQEAGSSKAVLIDLNNYKHKL